jgi:pimeloyl-ACP methyl ester carboxylesterase
MSQLDPFNIPTGDGTDRFSAYWRAACCGAGYLPTSALLTSLVQAAGGAGASKITLTIPLPDALYVCPFPGGGVMVLVNGTTAPLQYVAAVLGAVPLPFAGWNGRVHSFFGVAATAVAAILAPVLTSLNPTKVVYVGHSLGGSVACLLAARAQPWRVAGCWTMGQPRTGDGTFALSYPVPYERWTNTGDPVPLIPPARNPALDLTLFPGFGPLVNQYEHAGVRRHLYPDGAFANLAEASTWTEGAAFLLGGALTGGAWAGDHATASYACRLRHGINVPWATLNPAWPNLNIVDGLFAQLPAGPNGRCPDETTTDTGARDDAGPRFARQGRCQ